MPLLFSRPRRRVLFEIHEPCPGAFRYFGLRISVDEASELAETFRLVARPREIKVYEPVGSNYVGGRSFSRKTLHRTVQLFGPLALLQFRVQLGGTKAGLRIVWRLEDDLFVRRQSASNIAAHHHRIFVRVLSLVTTGA